MIGTVLSSILSVVLALAFVLGLAWGVIWLLRRMQDRQLGVAEGDGDNRPLRFLRALPLGQRERIVLVEAGDETLLLGITAGGISLLARWPKGHAPGSSDALADNFPVRPGGPRQ